MARYGLIIDISHCNGCYNCQLACKDEFVGNDYPPYSLAQPDTGQFWMRIEERERGKYPWVKTAYTPIPCMHCEDAPCMKNASGGAVYRRPDGIVLINPEKSKGQKRIVSSCPYGAIYWNDKSNIPQKCTFCAHLIDRGWKEPRCVEACPTLALRFGDLEDPKNEVSKIISSQKIEVLHPEHKTHPGVSYLNLPEFFIAGTIIFGDKDECGAGTKVSLFNNSGREIGARMANGFGDFEFDGIELEGLYHLSITAHGYETKTLPIDLKGDLFIGEVVLQPI